MKYLGIWDFIWLPMYLLLIHYLSNRIPRNKIDEHPEYKFYRRGFLAKIYGGLAFAFIYIFYYDGGDTTAYWIDAGRLAGLITSEPLCFFRNSQWRFINAMVLLLRPLQRYSDSLFARPAGLCCDAVYQSVTTFYR